MSFVLAHQNIKATNGRASTNVNPLYHENKDLTMNSKFPWFDFAKIRIQPKMKVSQHGDMSEQEADKVAEQLTMMPVYDSAASIIATKDQKNDRKSSDSGMKEEEAKIEVSRKPSATSDLQITDETANNVYDVLSTSGSTLDSSTRQFFEIMLGHDFSNVQIHSNALAEESAREVDANAYTVGQHIVFNKGRYEPNTREGRRLIAHELTHVMQQSGLDTISNRHQDERVARAELSNPLQVSKPLTRISSDQIAINERELQQGESTGRRLSEHRMSPIVGQHHSEPVLVQRAPPIPYDVPMFLDPYEHLSLSKLKKLARTDREAAESLRLRYRKMSKSKEGMKQLNRLAGSGDAMAKSVRDQVITKNKPLERLARGTGRFSDPDVLFELADDINKTRSEVGIRRTGSNPVFVEEVEGGTIGSARTNVPGFEDEKFAGKSPRAGGELNPSSEFSPATDIEVLPHTHGHAEQGIADRIAEAFKKVPPESLEGKTVWILIEQTPCSTCAQGAGNPNVAEGVLVKLSKKFPTVTFEIKNLNDNSIIILRNGSAPGTSAILPNKPLTPNALPETSKTVPKVKTVDDAAVHEPGPTKGSTGEWKAAAKGVGLMLAWLGASYIHGEAHANLVAENKAEKGYAKYGATGDVLHDIGTAILDPGNEADQSIPFSDRFDMARWRATMRAISNAKKPGEYWTISWQTSVFNEAGCNPLTGKCYRIKTFKVKYHKRGNRYQWLPISGETDDPPDIEYVLDEKNSDEEVRQYLELPVPGSEGGLV
jgi:hypothetical protein